MKKGKIVIVCGNKRAGKTTLCTRLQKGYGFNYISLDKLLDSLEETFPILHGSRDTKYVALLENLVKRDLEDAKNYGISTCYDYVFSPKELKKFKYRDDVRIIFLANLDANSDNILSDMKKYSKSYDWPSYASKSDIDRNIKSILEYNEELKEDAPKYNFELFNTSRGENRDKIIDEIIANLIVQIPEK